MEEKRKLTQYLRPQLHERVKALAETMDETESAVIETIVEMFFMEDMKAEALAKLGSGGSKSDGS